MRFGRGVRRRGHLRARGLAAQGMSEGRVCGVVNGWVSSSSNQWQGAKWATGRAWLDASPILLAPSRKIYLRLL